MEIKKLERGVELLREIKKLEAMRADAVVGKLFLSTIRKTFPGEVLDATTEVLRANIQTALDKAKAELANL